MSDNVIPFDRNDSTHHEKVSRWGKKHNFPLPPPGFLPDAGLIVNDTAAGFLYSTDGKIGWIEWIFSNPEKTEEERTIALDTLMKSLEKIAAIRGLKAVLSAAKHDAYRNVLKRNGFQETESGMTHHHKHID